MLMETFKGMECRKLQFLKYPQNYSLLQTRLRDLLFLRVGLVSLVEHQEVQFIIHQILTQVVQEAHILGLCRQDRRRFLG